MGLTEQVKQALQKAIERAGNMLRLCEKSGVNYSSINRFNSGKNNFKNMTLNTLERLFPELLVYFFRDERPAAAAAPPPLPTDLDAVERKLVRLARDMTEEGKLEAIDALAVLRERHAKNRGAAKQHREAG